MTDAVAEAGGAPAAEVRRAHQLRRIARRGRQGRAGRGGRRRPDDAAAALRAFTLRVGQPVRPMLAASAPSIEAALERSRPPRSSGRSTASGSRSTATATRVAGVHQDARRHHRPGARDRRDGTGPATSAPRSSTARRWRSRPDGRPRPFQVTSARAASQSAPPRRRRGRGAASVPLTAVLLRPAAPRRRGPDRPAGSERFERLAAIAPAGRAHPAPGHRGPGAGRPRSSPTRSASGHEGVVVKALGAPYGRPARQRLDQGQAAAPPSTWSSSPPSGATAGAPAGCPTCTWAPATRRPAGSSCSARRSRASPTRC